MATRRDPQTGKCRRGTSNRNRRGSAETRRRRKVWLIETYRANVDLIALTNIDGQPVAGTMEVEVGMGIACCRCYRCGDLLTIETITVDRIIPECKGGTYRRNNIRPACGGCNSETGGALANSKVHKMAKARAKKRVKKVGQPKRALEAV